MIVHDMRHDKETENHQSVSFCKLRLLKVQQWANDEQ